MLIIVGIIIIFGYPFARSSVCWRCSSVAEAAMLKTVWVWCVADKKREKRKTKTVYCSKSEWVTHFLFVKWMLF